ncbi:hypothetical protein [Ferrimonas kyonanensis]|uniref:M61 family metallopeptidase n=1 Tax=Ferrimonas kyonanensis TaxID=364763 RepID=UPI0009FE3B3E|nr:hypothetical protein [Ferrimonas kyonanensis]
MGWRMIVAAMMLTSAAAGAAICSDDMRIQMHPSMDQRQQSMLRQWLVEAARTVSDYGGAVPVPCASIEVMTANRGQGPVPWAQVIRSGQEGIRFYVNLDYSAEAFRQDWTAMHEFSHLLLPFPGNDAPWFSEGLASYLQYLLLGRAGILTQEQALSSLDGGFRRGRAAASKHNKSLRNLSGAMWASRSYQRVYWSGAAYFFHIDVALRRLPAPSSLQQVVADFVACCRHSGRSWSVPQLIDQFDRLSGTSLFSHHYRQIIDDRGFPDVSDAYAWLGMVADGASLQLSPEPELRRRRTQLVMGAPAVKPGARPDVAGRWQ